MLYKQYKYKFYLNINHAVVIDGKRGQIHSHTWEISMSISLDDGKFLRFNEIEKEIKDMLGKFQDKYINEVPPFNKITPTLENVCNYLYDVMSVSLKKKGWLLLSMEMSETPARVYQLSGISTDDFTFV